MTGVTEQGGASWASVAARSATSRASSAEYPVVIDREGCLLLELPPDTRITLAAIAVAIGKVDELAHFWQPFMHNRHFAIQALASTAHIESMRTKFLAEGLQVGAINVKCAPLVNSVNNKDLLEGKV